MGYAHISNLYKDQEILMFRECYALEKIHGTSAHVAWKDNSIRFFSGGASHALFIKLFDEEALRLKFAALGSPDVTVHGEAYGGKEQGQRHRYGDNLKFIAFDVKIDGCWLAVPQAEEVAKSLGLEFVHYVRISTDLPEIDAQRDADSVQAVRNGITEPMKREGVVLRPLIEVRKNNGERIVAKHKGDEFKETATPRKVVDQDKQKVIEEAEAIAFEWVTHERLLHVLDKLGQVNMEDAVKVIRAMQEDVNREAAGEIVASKDADRAIGRRAVQLFKKHLQANIGLQPVV